MKIINYIKSKFLRAFSLFFVCLILLDSIMLFSFYSSPSDVDRNNLSQLNNQAVNSVAESSCTKVNIKLLPGSYSANFYCYEYYFRRLGRNPKIFTIISETDSEHNICHSSFLLCYLTTSTQILSDS